MISTYTVTGMTCEHCVRAVTEEVSQVPGVEQAVVDLGQKSLSVTSQQPIDLSLIEAAVDEAGDYQVSAA